MGFRQHIRDYIFSLLLLLSQQRKRKNNLGILNWDFAEWVVERNRKNKYICQRCRDSAKSPRMRRQTRRIRKKYKNYTLIDYSSARTQIPFQFLVQTRIWSLTGTTNFTSKNPHLYYSRPGRSDNFPPSTSSSPIKLFIHWNSLP